MRWIQKISEYVRSQPDVFRFLVFGFGGYIVWHLMYEECLKPATLLDEFVTHHLIISTEWAMESLGYLVNAYFQVADGVFRTRVGVAGAAGVTVGPSCDGVVLFALFAIFILSFPGHWLRKTWFIPVGVFVIHTANIFRIICLLWIQLYFGEDAMTFNHDYTFTVFVYGIIFLLWYLYAAQGSSEGPPTMRVPTVNSAAS